jgi:TetR/AcrR family transcriptional regulator, regulator of autoinduction and epiphytic fitness
MKIPSPKKNKRDTAPKRDSIIDAAGQIFQEAGYDNASMDSIAERAGASKRTVYNHYESKEVLFRAVIDKYITEMQAIKEIKYDSSRSLEEQLSDFADAEIAVIENPNWLGLSKLLISIFIRDNEMARKTKERSGSKGVSLLAWLQDASKDRKISVKNPHIAARIFISLIQGAFTWPAMFQGPPENGIDQELKKEIIDMFLNQYSVR